MNRQPTPSNDQTIERPEHRPDDRPDDPLQRYRAKRNFGVTPEPDAKGGSNQRHQPHQPHQPPLTFVVQKHWARSLHYDFRLELEGTLKSWAVPKGPSAEPGVKRMAVQVEDHPLAYATFEGTIPAGQYGAGEVIVWDAGTWTPLHDPQQGLRDGNLKFELHGQQLHGRWVLVRMKGQGEKQAPWLLIKEKDAPASADGHTPSHPDPHPQSHPGAATAGPVPSALPPTLAPQLATLVAAPPADAADWLYEIKFDGYRMLVRNGETGARLLTRNGHDWTAKLRPLQLAFEALRLPSGWYDGEIVVPNEAGVPDFGALQQAFDMQRTGDVVLYLFDLPYADGHDLRGLPLQARRQRLQALLAASKAPSKADTVRFSEAFEALPDSLVASACKLGLEGLIAKRRSSPYRSGRSTDWLKLKCSQRQEFVIGGYTAPQGSRTGFGALLLGVYGEQGGLQYAGDVGTGFSQQALRDIQRQLASRVQGHSPFVPSAAGTPIDGRPTWVAPTLVAEVSFAQWTRAGRIRHAVFRGLRSDKPTSDIVREKALRLAAAKASGLTRKSQSQVALDRASVSNPQRVIDARSGTTKLDLVRFYSRVGRLMMPHLKGRPVSLLRAPDGVDGPLFFQKHAESEKLPGLRQIAAAAGDSHAPMIEVAGPQGLLSAAQWGVVEFHTLNVATANIDRPDRMVFDLDPGEGVAWAQVQEAAQLVQAFLGQLGLAAFLKTSGGKGLHVVVPLKRLHGGDTVKGYSQAVVAHMAQTLPQRFVARSGPKNRVGKIFIDALRNGSGASTVCAWSARARPGMGVSVPVGWAELPALRGGDHWCLQTVHERLDIGNEPWAGYARAARGLSAAMAALGWSPPTA